MPDFQILTLRKLADTSAGARAAKVDANGNVVELEPWPLAGVAIEGTPPAHTTISTNKVSEGRKEGWITGTGERVTTALGGPADDPTRVVHTFVEYDTLTFHTVDGDVTYTVVRNPGKYPLPDADRTEVVWFYTLELVEG